jgi:hypothetical protein
MDAMNILYTEYVKPLPLKHKEKQIRSRWHDAYQKFISYELRAFDIDQLCELCDIMNNFEAHIHNDIEKFRVACMDRFMKYDLETRLTLSAILASNALAQSAQILHKAQRGKVNDNIETSCVWSLKLLNEYADKRLDRSALCVDLNEFQEINLASRRMCRSIIAFAESLKF